MSLRLIDKTKMLNTPAKSYKISWQGPVLAKETLKEGIYHVAYARPLRVLYLSPHLHLSPFSLEWSAAQFLLLSYFAFKDVPRQGSEWLPPPSGNYRFLLGPKQPYLKAHTHTQLSIRAF